MIRTETKLLKSFLIFLCDQEFEFFLHGRVILRGAREVQFSVIRNLEEKEHILTRSFTFQTGAVRQSSPCH